MNPLLVGSVGIELPTVEVRFENIHIETSLYTDTERNLPTILNSYRAGLEVSLSSSTFAFHQSVSLHKTLDCMNKLIHRIELLKV